MRADNLSDMFWHELARPVPRVYGQETADSAEMLLEQAVEDNPDDIARWYALVDHWLEKGNFIRAAGILDHVIERFPDAGAAYSRRADALTALNPDQSAKDAKKALALGASPPPAPLQVGIDKPAAEDKVTTIYADITDMMDYLTLNMSMSGIQRVAANMLRCAMDRTSPNARDVQPIIPDYINQAVYTADPALVRELMDEVELRSPDRDRLNRLLSAIRTSLRAIEPEPGSIVLIAGAFWIVNSYDLLKALRQRGVIITIFIHDLIQIDNPEFVHWEATVCFRRCLLDVAEIANFFTTNSAFVARELRRFLIEETGLDTPVYPVPLATEMTLAPPEPWEEASFQAEYGDAGYVLCVCTIEIRKNHIYLIRIWQELMRAGRTDLPTLVFVGKWGWEVRELRALLEQTNYLDGKVRVMTGVPDALLASLYRNSLFTVYPSFAEGWGLPIGESLVLGRPCISSGVTSMPEVGGSLVRYVDPLDLQTGLKQIARVLDDRDDLAAWTDEVRTRFKPRSWAAFAEQLLGASRSLARITAAVPPAFARIRPGELAVVDDTEVYLAGEAGSDLRSARMAREHGWLALADFGAWSSSPLATLRFVASGCAPGEKLRVVVSLRGEPGQPVAACQLRSGKTVTGFRELETLPSLCAVDAVVDKDGTVEIVVLTRGEPIKVRGYRVYVCLTGLGYHRRDNADEALALMESATFRP